MPCSLMFNLMANANEGKQILFDNCGPFARPENVARAIAFLADEKESGS